MGKIKYIIIAICICLSACSDDEEIISSSIDVFYREFKVESTKATLTLEIDASRVSIYDGNVIVSTSEDMSNAETYPIEEIHQDFHYGEFFTLNCIVPITNLHPSTKYYLRVELECFVGNDNYTGQYNTLKFSKKTFTTKSLQYTIVQDGFIDLGLSVKWSARNLCAGFPTEAGIHAGWGDPTGKLDTEVESDYAGKNPPYNISGTQWDICSAFLENSRLPTMNEFAELYQKCDWFFTTYRGSYGWVVIGSTGYAIFIPSTNKENTYVPYWTGTFNITRNQPVWAGIYNGDQVPKFFTTYRYQKGYFRPVKNN